MPSRLLRLLFVMLTGCGTGSQRAPAPDPPLPRQVTSPSTAPREALEYDIYSAVLEQLFVRSETELLVLHQCSRPEGMPPIFARQLHRSAPIDSLAMEDFLAASEQPRCFERRFRLRVPYTLLTEAERRSLFAEGPEWSDFYAHFPSARGLLWLSRVGLNPSRDRAIVGVTHRFQNLGGNSEYVILHLREGQWRVQERIHVSSS